LHVRIGVSRLQVDPLTEANLAKGLVASAQRHHNLGQWWCELFLVMPDHVHAILRLQSQAEMSESILNWKRITALTHAVCWEDGFFSHPLRHRNEADQAWWHIRDNPVARGLCATEDEWRWWWSALSPMS
jgi:REP element-mobilizing transposase RayT